MGKKVQKLHRGKLEKGILEKKQYHSILQRHADVNPIEHLWEHLKREKVKHAVTSKDNLWEILSDCWFNIKAPVLQALVKSMPKRVNAVLKARGAHTKY